VATYPLVFFRVVGAIVSTASSFSTKIHKSTSGMAASSSRTRASTTATNDDPAALLEFCAVVGTKLPLRPDDKYQVRTPPYYRAILNLAMVMPSYGDRLPPQFTLLDKTFYGNSGSLSCGELIGPKIYLAYERESYSEAQIRTTLQHHRPSSSSSTTPPPFAHLPRPALTDIQLIHPGEAQLLTGGHWQVLTTNVTGERPANANTGVSGKPLYVSYRREQPPPPPPAPQPWTCPPRIVDLCLIDVSKHERVPFGYVQVEQSFNSTCWRGGHALHLCVKYSPACEGQSERPYRPVVLDSYFSSNGGGGRNGKTIGDTTVTSTASMLHHLPMFGFPRGIRILRPGTTVVEEQEREGSRTGRNDGNNGSNGSTIKRKEHDLPLPRYSHFVLTNEHNTTLYGTRLVYYEKVLVSKALPPQAPPTNSPPTTRATRATTDHPYQPPSHALQPPEPDFVANMHHALWTGVVQHRNAVAVVTRRYCVLNDVSITV